MKDNLTDYEKRTYEYHVGCLLDRVREDFDGPIYRNEGDLETVRNSESVFVGVVAEDEPAIYFVSREKFLRGEIGLTGDDLFVHAGVT